MTEGSIAKHLMMFAIPLILGNLFQQLYNTVDSIIVGNYIGSEALAAVGSSGSIINLLIGFVVGTSVGAGVVISQYYGANNQEKLKEAVHTTIAISFIAGIVLSVAGVILTPVILRLMGTPNEVLGNSIVYLRIYFGGILFNIIYNMAAGILNAVGNSKRSLVYLAIAAITNIILDFVFVVYLHMGVEGVAIATDISQLISSILVIRFLVKSKEGYRLYLKEVKIHKDVFQKIIKIGIPTGIQNIVISFSNVIVQSSVNRFGAFAMAGFGAYIKVDGFNILPVLSFSMAATTFAGQNYGAGKLERVKKGIGISIGMGVIYSVCTGVLLLLFDTQVLSVFSSNEQVISYGVQMLHYFCPFYFILAIMHIASGTIRGAGKTVEPMLIFLANLCVLRIVWILISLRMTHQIKYVFMSYPISWITGAICMLLYMWKGKWLEK